MAPAVERALARVDLGAVERNCAALAGRTGSGTSLCAVVKAGGYGHGAPECALAAQAGGASWIAVVSAEEAEELRLGGVAGPLLVMGALIPDEIDAVLATGADLATWRVEFLEEIARRAQHNGVIARVHVKLDTGMGRLGTSDPDEALEIARRAIEDDRVELAGFWTHLATADEPDSDFFDEQLGLFEPVAAAVKELSPQTLVHAANSAATIRDPRSHFDMVRCGVAIYGLDPFQRDPGEQDLEPALSLHSYVADVKRFPPGASAGYGRRWRAERETCVGVLPIGYADGVRRGLGNNADILVGGARHPLVGTVSMDNVTIDLGPDTEVVPGDPAVLIGRQGSERILAEELAERLGTINYEITCGIGPRVRREHVR